MAKIDFVKNKHGLSMVKIELKKISMARLDFLKKKHDKVISLGAIHERRPQKSSDFSPSPPVRVCPHLADPLSL